MGFPPIRVPFNGHHPYNPSYPYILGLEYVPIQNDDILFLPEPTTEYGYRYRDEGAIWRAGDDDGDYNSDSILNGMPSALVGVYDILKQPQFARSRWYVNLYPPGGEYAMGAVKSVTVPMASFTATGNTALDGNDTYFGADTTAMVSFRYRALTPSDAPSGADFAFDLTGYRDELYGKRILDVSLLYSGSFRDYDPAVTGLGIGMVRQIPVTYDPQFRQYKYEPLGMVALMKTAGFTGLPNASDIKPLVYTADSAPRGWGALPAVVFQSSDWMAIPPNEQPIGQLSMGNSTRGISTEGFLQEGEFDYNLLEALHPSFPLAGRLSVRLWVQIPNTPNATVGEYPRLVFNFIGLKITYCNESRIGFGPVALPSAPGNPGQKPQLVGSQFASMYRPRWTYTGSGLALSTIYSPGNFPKGIYTVTLATASVGEDGGRRQRFTSYPLLATRPLYPNPMLDPVAIEVPYPATSSSVLGKTSSVTQGELMPKLTLLPKLVGEDPVHRYNSHVYSRQAGAHVYGEFNASQKVMVASAAVAELAPTMENIRFYARHEPGTTVPLRVQQDIAPGAVFQERAAITQSWTSSAISSPVTGDISIIADFTYFGWDQTDTFQHHTLLSWGSGVRLYLTVQRRIVLSWTDNLAVTSTASINVPASFAAPYYRGRLRVKADLDVNNGAGGNTASFYLSAPGTTRWTFIGSTTAVGTTNLNIIGGAPIEIVPNSANALTMGRYEGKMTLIMHSLTITDPVTGRIVANPAFDQQRFDTISDSTEIFSDSANNMWTGTGAPIYAADQVPTAEITPAEFDALEPLTVDGWREVNLRLDPPLDIPLTVPYLRWTALGERAGSRWEIMAVSSWEPSGNIQSSFITQWPLGLWNSTDPGTYTGRDDGLQWVPQMGPYATGGTDFRTDASFLLASDPDDVGGLASSQLVQDLGYAPNDCNITPCGIATGLNYTHLEWDPKPYGAAFRDKFDREETGGWGSPTYGPDYIRYGGPELFSVDGTGGIIDLATQGTGLLRILQSPAVTGTFAYTLDAAALDITGDIDLRADALLTDWSLGVDQALINKWETTPNQRSYALVISSTGAIQLTISTDGTLANTHTFGTTNLLSPFLNGTRLSVRATLDVDDGSGNAVARFYTGPSVDGPWTEFDEPQTTPATLSIFASTTHVEVGSRNYGINTRVGGIVYAAQIRNGIDGTIVANPNFEAQSNGNSNFTDSAGLIWRLFGTYADIRYQDNPGTPVFVGHLVPLPDNTMNLADGLHLDGTIDAYAYTPDDPALAITSDIDIRVDFTPTKWADATVSADQEIVNKWDPVSGNNCSWRFLIRNDGYLRLVWSPTGNPAGVNIATSTTNVPGVSGTRIAIRVQRVGGLFTFYTGTPTGDLDTVTWNRLGDVVLGATTMFVSTADLAIGKDTLDATLSGDPLSNKTVVHAVQIRDGAGDIVAYPRFDQQEIGTTSFVDEVSLPWSLNGNATIASGAGSNFDMTVTVTQLNNLDQFETPAYGRIYGRWVDEENFYYVDLVTAPEVTGGLFSVDDAGFQGLYLQFGKYAGGYQQVIDERQLVANPYGYGAGVGAKVRWMFHENIVKIKVWPENYDEPLMWTIETEVASYSGVALPGVSGSYVSTPDTAALDITGDIDIRADFSMDVFPPTSTQTLVAKYVGSVGSRGYMLRVLTSGFLSLSTSPDGTTIVTTSATAAIPYIPGKRIAVRVTLDVDNGSGGRTGRFYYGYPTTDLSNVTWYNLSSTTTAGTTSIFANSQLLTVGAQSNGTTEPFQGFIYAVQVRNGIDGTIVANPIFSTGETLGVDSAVVAVPGIPSFVDSAGRTWTFQGDAFIPFDPKQYGYKIGYFAKHEEGFASYKFSDIYIGPPRYWFGYYEMQRMDEEDPDDWQTIMKATDPVIVGFNDYEARPGIQSWYRIREVDKYGFVGSWSSEVSGMIPAPGAIGGECLTDGHMLLFTTNEVQDGSSNLAYSSVWENGTVTEDFTFPDAAVVQMQAMYNRDFFTAFRPMERAGEQFERNVLVQAAAVSPTILANFTSLRDLSWEALNYVCVRDEDGNRWLATISIPTGSVKRRRTIYIAPVHIAEVTETPTPVDPEWLP